MMEIIEPSEKEKDYAWKSIRVQTRITGLDRLLYGGLTLSENPYFILMKGAADTEKTMFGMQMLYGIAQSLSDDKMEYKNNHIPYFISTYNTTQYLNSLAVNAFISTNVRYYQKKNLHRNLQQSTMSSSFTNILFNTDKIICTDYLDAESSGIPFSEIVNRPDNLIVEGALYYNVRTNAIHFRTSEKKDDKKNMIYKKKYNTIHEYTKDSHEPSIPDKLKDLLGTRMIDYEIHGEKDLSEKILDISNTLLGIELKTYSKHKIRLIKDKITKLKDRKCVFLLIVDEHTTIFDDDADMIIDLSSEYADDYLSYFFRITKSRLQDAALGYHQYKQREYGIEVFPSIHFYIQQRWYQRRSLLYTHSNIISERYFEYLSRKRFLGSSDISYTDYLTHRDENKKKWYEDIFRPEILNFASYDLLNKILILESIESNTETENIYGNVGSVTGIIGNGNTYKRYLTFGGAFSTAIGNDHVLMLLLNKEDNTIRRRLACPARLLKRKHKDADGCMQCYEHIHFMNIPMGAITPEEFLYYFDRQLRSKYEQGKRIKRVIIDDLQIIDYCYPKLEKDPLFLPALMNVSREYGVALYLLCDKQCKLRYPLRALADNIICTEKTEKGNPIVYIERYAGYNITPSKMYCGEVMDIEKLFVCHECYNENGKRISRQENYMIDSTVIKDRDVSDITHYWNK